jgi:uncharacterized membrane protein YkoI
MKLPTLMFAAFCAAAAAPAVLAGKDDHLEAQRLLAAGEILPLARVLEIVRREVPGPVVEVELEREDDDGPVRWEYDVEVLMESGIVRKVKLDARDGRVLRIEDD